MAVTRNVPQAARCLAAVLVAAAGSRCQRPMQHPSPTRSLAGEDQQAARRKAMVARLRRLDLPYTDWVLLRDVSEKVAAAGPAAQPIVAVEVELARTNKDPRYRVRLLGVQSQIDTAVAVDELAKVVVGDDEDLAALAARVLGRVGAPTGRPTGRIAELLRDRLAKETRLPVRGALILAAGEAGATESAPLLQVMVEKGAVEGNELLWTWTALAQIADGKAAANAQVWLTPESRLLGVAVLLARRFRDREAERPLLKLFAKPVDEPVLSWIVQTLGAIGGDDSRQALRAAIDADKARVVPLVIKSDIDPRWLALLRLGDKDARVWAIDQVLRAETMLPVGTGRVPELFGKWRIDGAAERLLEWATSEERPLLVRASAARGLCWLRDSRGLRAAAVMLGTAGVDSTDPVVLAGLRLAQQTLHEFVADVDRPDYVGLVPGDDTGPPECGLAWREWLRSRRAGPKWRWPFPDSTDLQSWY